MRIKPLKVIVGCSATAAIAWILWAVFTESADVPVPRPAQPAPSPSRSLTSVRAAQEEEQSVGGVAASPERRAEGNGRFLVQDASEPWPTETSEVLARIAAESRVPQDEIVRRIRAQMPQRFESELTPLTPWPEVAPNAPDDLVNGFFGTSPAAVIEKFEYASFDKDIDSFISANTDQRTLHERVLALRGIANDARDAFDTYVAEAQAAILHKAGLDKFDRWPYVTINETRRFTDEPRKKTLSLMGGIGRGWVVQLDIYRGEYPSFDSATTAWYDVLASARTKVKEWKAL